MMQNNYDNIAKYYDTASRLVFGKAQFNAQINQLQYIGNSNSILVVGGGTGWILEEIAKIKSSGLNIIYVELSTKMIELAKVRNYGLNNVSFINTRIEDFDQDISFDIILTPFLFDNFLLEKCESVFRKLDTHLKKDGLWFLVDFTVASKKGNRWKKVFLKVMYRFFKIISQVEAKALINMNPFFIKANYQIVNERFYYQQFIQAIIYRK